MVLELLCSNFTRVDERPDRIEARLGEITLRSSAFWRQ
jgi:hypothetical protein